MISDLAEKEQVPVKFLETILLELNQAGLLDSRKGRRGGYQLGLPPEAITVNAVITALEGPFIPLPCAVGADRLCEECLGGTDCPARFVARGMSREMNTFLDGMTLGDLMQHARLAGPADPETAEPVEQSTAFDL